MKNFSRSMMSSAVTFHKTNGGVCIKALAIKDDNTRFITVGEEIKKTDGKISYFDACPVCGTVIVKDQSV